MDAAGMDERRALAAVLVLLILLLASRTALLRHTEAPVGPLPVAPPAPSVRTAAAAGAAATARASATNVAIADATIAPQATAYVRALQARPVAYLTPATAVEPTATAEAGGRLEGEYAGATPGPDGKPGR